MKPFKGIFICTGSRVLLVALVAAHFPVLVISEDTPELRCSELSARRDRLRAQIEWLHAEAALVEAELGSLCTAAATGTPQTDMGMPPPSEPALPSATPRRDRNIGTSRHKKSTGASNSARTLLQELTPAEPACSMDELMAVQANPMGAVVGLFTTNPSCAVCLVPCGNAADAVSCAMGCLKQARVLTQRFLRFQVARWHFSHLFPKARFHRKGMNIARVNTGFICVM